MFDVSDMPLPYNGILGRPALAKFMAVAHYAYNMVKIPAEWGVLTVKADNKDAVFYVEQMYPAAAASEPSAEPGSSPGDEPGCSTPAPPAKRSRVTLESVPGVTPGGDTATTSGSNPGKATSVGPAPRRQLMKGEPQLTKKVPLHGDTSRGVIIGTRLSEK